MRPSVVILTYNSELSIAATLLSVKQLSDDIHIVDSFSKDRTVEIARSFGAHVTEHPFENYGAQRNWSIHSLSLKYAWQLHLDADERLSPELQNEIMALGENVDASGFHLPRLMLFLGKPIRHGGLFPTWHMRLFRTTAGRCEARKYDQHFYVISGTTIRLTTGYVIDDIRMPLTEWTIRHNRWSDAEVEEQGEGLTTSRIAGKLFGNPVQRMRFLRRLYDNAPLFVRPFGLFFYRYFVRLGFMDGTSGFIFYVLQTFWFRFLIDAKLYEKHLE